MLLLLSKRYGGLTRRSGLGRTTWCGIRKGCCSETRDAMCSCFVHACTIAIIINNQNAIVPSTYVLSLVVSSSIDGIVSRWCSEARGGWHLFRSLPQSSIKANNIVMPRCISSNVTFIWFRSLQQRIRLCTAETRVTNHIFSTCVCLLRFVWSCVHSFFALEGEMGSILRTHSESAENRTNRLFASSNACVLINYSAPWMGRWYVFSIGMIRVLLFIPTLMICCSRLSCVCKKKTRNTHYTPIITAKVLCRYRRSDIKIRTHVIDLLRCVKQ